jgi:hypothetical protein
MARQWAVLKAMADYVKQAMDAGKYTVMDELAELGVERIAATLPDGTVLAHVTRVQPTASKAITDEAAFIEWVERTYPAMVYEVPQATIVVPAHKEIAPSNRKELLDSFDKVDEVLVDEMGEVVPGTAVVRGKEPYLMVKWVDGGREAIGRAIVGGLLAEALALPEAAEGGE